MKKLFRNDLFFKPEFPFAILHVLNGDEEFNIRRRFTREFWKITYVVNGSSSFIIGEESYPIAPGTIYLVHPDDETTYDLAPGTRLELYNIIFDAGFVTSFLQELKDNFHFFSIFSSGYKREKGPYCYIFAASDTVREKISALEAEYENNFSNRNAMIRLLLQELLLLLLRSSEERFRRQPELIASYIRYRVIEHFKEPLNLQTLAAETGVTPNHLCRLYRKYFNNNLNSDLQKLRLEYAGMRLKNSKESILDICYACGFRDLSYFYRSFKRHYGVTPASFRSDIIGQN